MSQSFAHSSIDLYSDDTLADPYAAYRELRDAGPVVHLDKLGMYVAARYRETREILDDPAHFLSGHGVMMNPPMNEALRGLVLCSDGDEHEAMRRVLMKPMTPGALRTLRDQVVTEAEALVERLVARGRFDAVTELAQHLPVTIVSHAVGLPEEGREKMLDWAEAAFNGFGPMNPRTLQAFDTMKETVGYAMTQCVRGKLKPGGWADRLHDAADAGEIPKEKPSLMALDYVGPSLDTTIFAISNAVWLFAQNPEQWRLVREDPSLIPRAINEVIRLESPIQSFSRYALNGYAFEGAELPAHSRVIVLYGSANRDERFWPDAERFDVRRANASEQIGFGHGEHVCAGMGLARLEMTAVLTALAKRVDRFELRDSRRRLNNLLRGFASLEVSVH